MVIKRTCFVIVTGEREGRGRCVMTAVILGEGAPLTGLKHALVTSRNSRSAFPPSLVPKWVDSDRSGAIGEVGGPHGGKTGATLDNVSDGLRLAPHSGQLGDHGSGECIRR
jgi:hypothetical protein